MHIIDWVTFAEQGVDTDAAVSFTIGVFDGVHKGHLQLINSLTGCSDTLSVVATFKKNPSLFLKPDDYMGDICSLKCKMSLLEEAGVDIVILIDFSPEFSKLTGRDFFEYIRKHLNLSHLVLGKDHRLGYKGDTGASDAEKMLSSEGVKVDIVEPLYLNGGPVSSTRIRNAIIEGRLTDSETLLGRKHCVSLENAVIYKENNSLKIERNEIKQVIPSEGRYAVTLSAGNKTFATKLRINEERLLFDSLPDFQTETLTFNSLLLQE